ncbi:hypothetical protein [Paenibacillus peoriae]|uniref:hypothetical protein n=1 Tax=Paenibacillus peoriae TaxID=59893 RepID=UPI001CC1DE93|nr:hypothetical protein [Paenibacillus peoriae]
MKLRVTTDFGNSKTKMRINGERIEQPSVIKRLHNREAVSETDNRKNHGKFVRGTYSKYSKSFIKKIRIFLYWATRES